MANDDADFLMISGLKHFAFCKRRWALVHIEQLWNENPLTMEGHFMHERVHDEGFTEMRGSVLLSRAMPVRSEKLKITGECDMVEMYSDDRGIPIHDREGLWRLMPVEYKHGRPDERGADEMQLCAQAMCLEEMFVTEIKEGAVYYGETRHRMKVPLTNELRLLVEKNIREMRLLFDKGHTPKIRMTKACKSCSMLEMCQPVLGRRLSVSDYVRQAIEDSDT